MIDHSQELVNLKAAGGLVVFEKSILLLRNRYGAWVLPKGRVEPGETEEIAAIREVKEETGVEAQILRPIGTTSYFYKDHNQRMYCKNVSWFLMTALRPELVLSRREGFYEAIYAPLAEALVLLTYESDISLLTQLFNEEVIHKEDVFT